MSWRWRSTAVARQGDASAPSPGRDRRSSGSSACRRVRSWELDAAVLRQDPILAAVGERAAADAICPFKGLASFDESDAECFFGRDLETAA